MRLGINRMANYIHYNTGYVIKCNNNMLHSCIADKLCMCVNQYDLSLDLQQITYVITHMINLSLGNFLSYIPFTQCQKMVK